MILAVVHLFYVDFWPELAACVRNIGACDLVVTYIDEVAAMVVRREFPRAKCVRVENRGFDVWPFLRVIQGLDLSAYDLVVKLHSKRDCDIDSAFNGLKFSGGDWRERLLGFCRTPGAWQRTLSRFADPRVGMVAGRGVVVTRSGIPTKRMRRTFDRARRDVEEVSGLCIRGGSFVAGTMFAVRPQALVALRPGRFTAEDFPLHQFHAVETYAHQCERMLGLAVRAAGLKIVEFDRSTTAMFVQTKLQMLVRAFGHFLYQRKITASGHVLVKVCKIPVVRKRVSE